MKNKSGFEKFYKDKKSGGAKKEAFRKEKREVRKERSEKIEAKKARFKPPPARPGNGPARDWQSDIKNIKSEIRDGGGAAGSKPRFIKKDTPGGAGRPNDTRSKKGAPNAVPERAAGNSRHTGTGNFKERKNGNEGGRPQVEKRTRPDSREENRHFKKDRPEVKKAPPGRKKEPVAIQLKPQAGEARPKPARQSPAGSSFKQASGIVPQQAKPLARQASLPETISEMPLNKYIAHGGICSRRDAAALIRGGKVKVNGELILEPGHKVSVTDEVKAAGKKVTPVREFVYILVNKPKDFITTTDDPQGRRTVLDLIRHATSERVYPVGRLDRNTSGVLLLTNDGELSQKLTHPSNEITKIYSVTLDKPLQKADFEAILKGVPLDDGPATVDVLAYSDAKDKTQIGVELHTGRNRVVRRIFEHFGYEVKNLDRVVFAGLTKKNVERGKWRHLAEKEVRQLKYFGKGK